MEVLLARFEGFALFGDVSCLRSFQMNYLWLITMKRTDAKRKLFGVAQLLLKNKKCFILDLNSAEVPLKKQ